MVRKIKKAALLFFIFPHSLKKKVSRYLNHTERTILAETRSQINKNDVKNILPVIKEFSGSMKIVTEKKLQRDKARYSAGSEIFFLFFLFLFGGTFFLFYMYNDFVKNMIHAGFLYILITLLMFLYMWIGYDVDVFKKWYTGGNLANSIFLGFVFSIITSTVMIIDNLLFVEEIIELRGVLFIVNLAVMVLIGPVIEEIIYRGVVIDFFNRWMGKIISIPVSAVLFSLVHIPNNFVDFLLVLFVGLCFGILYVMTRNLISSTVAHSLSNIAVFIFIR